LLIEASDLNAEPAGAEVTRMLIVVVSEPPAASAAAAAVIEIGVE
jgi:hypothetical protein